MHNTAPKSIHRKLVFRISLMGLCIALLSGTIIWQFEKDRVDQSILLKSENSFKRMNNQVRHLLNTPADLDSGALKKELVDILSRREVIRIGQYVWIGIYTLDGQPVANVLDNTYENAELLKTITGQMNVTAAHYGKMKLEITELKMELDAIIKKYFYT